MNHRIRMARKRLMVARERIWEAWWKAFQAVGARNPVDHPLYKRKLVQFLAIERRKDKTA